jgi:multiple sugar transport system permease protein
MDTSPTSTTTESLAQRSPSEASRRARRGQRRIDWVNISIYAAYLVILLVFLGPLLWVISLSLKTRPEVLAYPPRLIPETFAWENYRHIWRATPIPLYLFNSAKLTLFAVTGGLFISVPAAFAYSRFRFRGRTVSLFGLLTFQMISPLVVAIPLYRYFNRLGLLDSHLSVIFVFITIQIPFTVWLLKGFFDSIPIELDDAARIDGCGRVQSLLLVILPLAAPGIFAAMVFNVISSWSQFIIPYILLSESSRFPVSVGILYFQTAQTEGELTAHLLAAAAVVAMMPALLVFAFLQRFVVSLMVAGAVKG